MFHKKLCVAVIAFLLVHESVEGKRSRKIKRTKPEDEISTPQPSVVSYSTFGFNDVGTYEGFVPSSPDYAKFLSDVNQETSTKEQPQRFPITPDSSGLGQSFSSQPFSGQSFTSNGESPIKLSQYSESSMFFNTPSFDSNNAPHKNIASEEIFGRNTDYENAPIYGTKLNSKNRNRPINSYNYTDFRGPTGGQVNDEKYSNFHEDKSIFDNRPSAHSQSNSNYFNNPSYTSSNEGDFIKPASNDPHNLLDFPKVVDFTKYKQYYSKDLETSRLPSGTPIPDVYENNYSDQNIFLNKFNSDNKENRPLFTPVTKQKDAYELNKDTHGENDYKNIFKLNNIKEDSYNFSNHGSENDNTLIASSDNESKKKSKNKPWLSGSNYMKKWKEQSPTKGYGYSTNFSTMNFKYETDENKISKPFSTSIDEIVPASSNLEFPRYKFPDTDVTSFKKLPEYKVHEDVDEFENFLTYRENERPKESQSQYDYSQYKIPFTTPPTSASYWGNVFKSSEYTSQKKHPHFNKHNYKDVEEVVNIPRRPIKFNYEKPYENKPTDWAQFGHRPYKSSPYRDWTKDFANTRFKSEEDLLGLRNQDTSHPSYLPSYKPNYYESEDGDYKKLVEKWRQSYLKSKLKDSLHDYEGYGSETKTTHVPVPKPYPIEVPHPVIVPVPQPYPVRVPIAKPVAVPVIRELKVPVEKPMPYVVYKDVPYPIEKRIPVPVEKEVPVPVVKPYPVHIPYIRPVFHHTKSRDEYDSDHRDDDDYFPRPESTIKSSRYKKKIPTSSRNRPRRPSRTVYHDRNRRRWPERRHPTDRSEYISRTRSEVRSPSPFKRNDVESRTQVREHP